MIKAEQLTKAFINEKRELTVIKNISFGVEQEEFVSIVGQSGCGKTTLLNMIAGLEKPTAGKIFINGEEMNGPGLNRGIFFQESPLFPWKTVSENIKLALKIKGSWEKDTESLAEEYLRKVNLLDFASFYPKELSGGMKQRVALARTLALGSEILLMDEPFGALDAQTRTVMQRELLKIWDEYKKTVLFVTHSIDEAIFLSDKIIILSPLPATVLDIIEVDFPRPRNFELRLTEKFNKLKSDIWGKIKNNRDD